MMTSIYLMKRYLSSLIYYHKSCDTRPNIPVVRFYIIVGHSLLFGDLRYTNR